MSTTEPIGAKVPTDLKRKIRLKAAVSGKNMSELIREVLESEFDNDPQVQKMLESLDEEELSELLGENDN